MDAKPVLHCLVAVRLPDGDYIVKRGDPIALEEAEAYARFGWEVIVDYADQEALTRWEQLNRPQKPRWNRW